MGQLKEIIIMILSIGVGVIYTSQYYQEKIEHYQKEEINREQINEEIHIKEKQNLIDNKIEQYIKTYYIASK